MVCPDCGAERAGTATFCPACGARARTVLGPGAVLQERYHVESGLGEGGMGMLYRVWDTRLHCRHVLKRLTLIGRTPEERASAIDRFQLEARLLSGLRHPNLPRVVDYFEDENRHFLVMDYIEGEDLDARLRRCGTPGLSEDEVRTLALTILDILCYLHGRTPPILHRDIKPANIVQRAKDGTVFLVDFGIARPATTDSTKTAIGTGGYASPEQFQGRAEPRSDLYSLGATLHHLLTGHGPELPFDFPPVRTLAPHVSEQMADVIHCALQFQSTERFAAACQMRRALGESEQTCLDDGVVTERHPARPLFRRIIQGCRHFTEVGLARIRSLAGGRAGGGNTCGLSGSLSAPPVDSSPSPNSHSSDGLESSPAPPTQVAPWPQATLHHPPRMALPAMEIPRGEATLSVEAAALLRAAAQADGLPRPGADSTPESDPAPGATLFPETVAAPEADGSSDPGSEGPDSPESASPGEVPEEEEEPLCAVPGEVVFPSRRALGLLRLRQPGAPRWTSIGEARGRVRIAEGSEVDLCAYDLSDGDMRYLRQIDDLQSLTLSNCRITDGGLAPLGDLERLEVFKLHKCHALTGQGLAHLAPLEALRSLAVEECRQVAGGLSCTRNIDTLMLGECDALTDEELESISTLESLKKLCIRQCTGISDRGLSHVPRIDGLRTLCLRGCAQISDVGLSHLGQVKSLKELSLRDCVQVTDGGLYELRGLSSLESLDLSRCSGITDQGLLHVSRLTHLRRLLLRDCELLTDRGLKHLDDLDDLEELDLSGCTQLTDAGLRCLAEFSGLRTVRVEDCPQVTADGREELDEALSHPARVASLTGFTDCE